MDFPKVLQAKPKLLLLILILLFVTMLVVFPDLLSLLLCGPWKVGGEVIPPTEFQEIPEGLDLEKAKDLACKYQAIKEQPKRTILSEGTLGCWPVEGKRHNSGFLVSCRCGGYENVCIPFLSWLVGWGHGDFRPREGCWYIDEARAEKQDLSLCEENFPAYNFEKGGGTDKWAYKGKFSEFPLTLDLDKVEFNEDEYKALMRHDFSMASFPASVGGERPFHLFVFKIRNVPQGTSKLHITWSGYGYGYAGSKSGTKGPPESVEGWTPHYDEFVEAGREEKDGDIEISYHVPSEGVQLYVWREESWELVEKKFSRGIIDKTYENEEAFKLFTENNYVYVLVTPDDPADSEIGINSVIKTDYIVIGLE